MRAHVPAREPRIVGTVRPRILPRRRWPVPCSGGGREAKPCRPSSSARSLRARRDPRGRAGAVVRHDWRGARRCGRRRRDRRRSRHLDRIGHDRPGPDADRRRIRDHLAILAPTGGPALRVASGTVRVEGFTLTGSDEAAWVVGSAAVVTGSGLRIADTVRAGPATLIAGTLDLSDSSFEANEHRNNGRGGHVEVTSGGVFTGRDLVFRGWLRRPGERGVRPRERERGPRARPVHRELDPHLGQRRRHERRARGAHRLRLRGEPLPRLRRRRPPRRAHLAGARDRWTVRGQRRSQRRPDPRPGHDPRRDVHRQRGHAHRRVRRNPPRRGQLVRGQ